MATYVFLLDREEGRNLELSWDGVDYFNAPIHVVLDGDEIGVIPDKKALKEGQVFPLPDGSAIHVQKTRRKGLEIFHSGRQLRIVSPAQSMLGDVEACRVAAFTVSVIGWYTLLLGIAVVVTGLFGMMGFYALYWMITGVAFLVLGYFTRQGYVVSLLIALVYYALDAIPLIILAAKGAHLSVAGIALHLLLICFLYKGIAPLRRLTEKVV